MESSTIRILNKRLSDENQKYKAENKNYHDTNSVLQQANEELELYKSHFEEMNEQIQLLKKSEKSLLKELLQLKNDAIEKQILFDNNCDKIKILENENQIPQASIEHDRVTLKDLNTKLEIANQPGLESNDRIFDLEYSLHIQHEENCRMIEKYEITLETLREDVRDTQPKDSSIVKERRKFKKDIEEKNIIIEDLHHVNHNQQLQLLDNAEEIRLLEQEIKAMQQIVKQKSKS
jgi:hypothetical protein